MHIVFVHRGVYPERIGGTYSYIYELGRRLAARGHRVRVIASTREPDAPAPYEHEGMLIHKYAFRRLNPVASTLQHLANTKRLFEEIHAAEPVDILTIHEAQLGYRLARSRLGRSVCQLPTFHAPVFLEFRLRVRWLQSQERSPLRRAVRRSIAPVLEAWQRRFEEGVLQVADGIHVLSQYSRGHIEQQFPGVDLDKVEIIPGGVDAERFKPADDRSALRDRLRIPADVLEILTVRNLSPRMGLENLILALRKVIDRTASDAPRLHLTVCGDGDLRASLESQIDELDLRRIVTLAGRVTDEELVQRYQAADLFVLPTLDMEGFGISTVEALSTGLPVIGTPAGATPEILSRIDARLVTRDTSAEAIAEAILAWLSWGQAADTENRYRSEVLRRYDWEHVADAMEEWYGAAVRESRAER